MAVRVQHGEIVVDDSETVTMQEDAAEPAQQDDGAVGGARELHHMEHLRARVRFAVVVKSGLLRSDVGMTPLKSEPGLFCLAVYRSRRKRSSFFVE
jgi:hypothetical protein